MAAILSELPEVLSRQFHGVPDVRVVVWDGWEELSAKTQTFEPRGVLFHDTGSQPGSFYLDVLKWCRETSPIAPLCHYLTGPDGPDRWRVDIICGNRANHAGRPDDEEDEHDAWVVDAGNTFLVGEENFWTMERGRQWDPRHLWVIRNCHVGVLRMLERDSSHLIGHKEFATLRKFDPRLIDMDDWRLQVALMLAIESGEITMAEADRIIEHIQASERRILKAVGAVPGDVMKQRVRHFDQIVGAESPTTTVQDALGRTLGNVIKTRRDVTDMPDDVSDELVSRLVD